MSFLWIRFLFVVHVWSGRRLQRAAVKRVLRALDRKLHDPATNPHWN